MTNAQAVWLINGFEFFYFRLNTLIDELAEMITERCRLY